MSRLPVIVAQGGISPAGRTSGFCGYRRIVFEALEQSYQNKNLAALRALRNLPEDTSVADVLSGTLVRQLELSLFGYQSMNSHHPVAVQSGSELIIANHKLPWPVPEGWTLEKQSDDLVKVRIATNQKLMVPTKKISPINAAGQLPAGVELEKLYQSRHHPRALAMTVFGASDALFSSGLDWHQLKMRLSPDQIAVYSGSAMSQLDSNGYGGMLQARLLGKRVTSKQCPLGFSEMSADFVNAYILGSLGGTGACMGACATLLYNLQRAVAEIRSGRRRFVLVGSSEAPVTPEIIEGYSAMGALITDKALRKLDGLDDYTNPDWSKASRPFGENAGFTIGESCQYLILMDDELAMECGADILGAVADVFIHADGYKKSISSPGAGNYLTFGRAAGLAKAIGGEQSLRRRSFVQAHGTSTPQNRVTESLILNEIAKAFDISAWPVAAVKSCVGHSIGAAGGDQIMATLGVWKHGIIPGIKTISKLADDVHSSRLNILMDHLSVGAESMDMALVNAKGFGGNNATALLLSPFMTNRMLKARYPKEVIYAWLKRREQIEEKQVVYEEKSLAGKVIPVYQFGKGVLSGAELEIDSCQIKVPGFGKPLDLDIDNPFWEF